MTVYTEQERKRQLEYDKKRWKKLKNKARVWGKRKGAPINMQDFEFILCNGGRTTEENTSYIDNCYIHRLEVNVPKDKKIYRFKTLTENVYDFSVPF